MIRVLMKGEWYEQVDPGTLYEAEFERLLCQQAEYVFPGFWICPCKLPVESEYGSAKPDLALIDRQYREWMVIELELGHHSFEGHVLPQVRRLRHGVYTARHAAYLHQKRPSLNRSRLADMIKGEQPKIMVLADEAHEEWTEELRRLSVGYYAFKVFRSDTEQYLFLTDLSLSALPAATVSYCRRDGVFASWLRLFSLPDSPWHPEE